MIVCEHSMTKTQNKLQRLPVNEWVQALKTQYIKLWWETPVVFPEVGPVVGSISRKYKEKRSEEVIGKLSTRFENIPQNTMGRQQWNKELKGLVRDAGSEFFGICSPELSELVFGGFMEGTQEFIRNARAFDSQISLLDIMQAMRNVWIMNCIQVLLGIEVQYTSAIFGYSMLYPVTDNFMDDPEIPARSKLEISQNFRKRLAGIDIEAENVHEKAIWKLVKAIEEQYPRRDYPEVYESLLCIHKAQEDSMEQQGGPFAPYEKDILGISIEKGATSVLADAFLVSGYLNERDADFIFGFGVLLQLIDDLQDVTRDIKNGHMTIFSHTAPNWKLDTITNRLFNFLLRHMKSWEEASKPQSREMLQLIKNNCILLMMEAISRNRKLFSRQYIKHMEAYSSYSFNYLDRLGKRLKKEYSYLASKNQNTSFDEVLAGALVQV